MHRKTRKPRAGGAVGISDPETILVRIDARLNPQAG
jgi:hypothetical protein